MKFLIHSSDLYIKKHRGHPFKSEDESIDNTDIPGIKSYYTISPLLESIRKYWINKKLMKLFIAIS